MTIDCKQIEENILEDVSGGCLLVIQCSEDESALSYVKQLRKAAEKVDIEILHKQPAPDDMLHEINSANEDKLISGIMLVSPLPKQYHLLEHIDPSKRVEGNDFDDQVLRVSCTARACVKIIKSVSEIDEKRCLIIGYGKAVGKPLGYLLMREHAASVTTTHRYTPEHVLKDHVNNSDIIITAVGKPNFFQFDVMNKVIIDAGISIVGNTVVGDVHIGCFYTNKVTPVPGGVGPVTTALLLRNVYLAKNGLF